MSAAVSRDHVIPVRAVVVESEDELVITTECGADGGSRARHGKRRIGAATERRNICPVKNYERRSVARKMRIGISNQLSSVTDGYSEPGARRYGTKRYRSDERNVDVERSCRIRDLAHVQVVPGRLDARHFLVARSGSRNGCGSLVTPRECRQHVRTEREHWIPTLPRRAAVPFDERSIAVVVNVASRRRSRLASRYGRGGRRASDSGCPFDTGSLSRISRKNLSV